MLEYLERVFEDLVKWCLDTVHLVVLLFPILGFGAVIWKMTVQP